MATANGLPNEFSVRQMTLDDIPGVIELQVRAFPGLPLFITEWNWGAGDKTDAEDLLKEAGGDTGSTVGFVEP